MQGHGADVDYRTGLRQNGKGVQHTPAELRHTTENRNNMGALRKTHLKRICAVKDIQIQAQGRNGRGTHILRMDAKGTPLPLRHAERTRHTASDREIINPNK